MKDRTRAYWPTRIMLVAAPLLPVVVALLLLSAPQSMGRPLYDDTMGWVGAVAFAVGGVFWLIGVVWMLRIVRGLRDEATDWRYRDR